MIDVIGLRLWRRFGRGDMSTAGQRRLVAVFWHDPAVWLKQKALWTISRQRRKFLSELHGLQSKLLIVNTNVQKRLWFCLLLRILWRKILQPQYTSRSQNHVESETFFLSRPVKFFFQNWKFQIKRATLKKNQRKSVAKFSRIIMFSWWEWKLDFTGSFSQNLQTASLLCLNRWLPLAFLKDWGNCAVSL